MCSSIHLLIHSSIYSLETEPQTEIEYQPIEAKPITESQQEVSTRPLPPEPVNPQFVISGNQTPVNPPQNASSEPVLPQPPPPVKPVSGKPPGIKTGPFTPSAIEPGESVCADV